MSPQNGLFVSVFEVSYWYWGRFLPSINKLMTSGSFPLARSANLFFQTAGVVATVSVGDGRSLMVVALLSDVSDN